MIGVERCSVARLTSKLHRDNGSASLAASRKSGRTLTVLASTTRRMPFIPLS